MLCGSASAGGTCRWSTRGNQRTYFLLDVVRWTRLGGSEGSGAARQQWVEPMRACPVRANMWEEGIGKAQSGKWLKGRGADRGA